MTPTQIIGDCQLYLADKRRRRGVDNPLYKGGKSIDANGYVIFTSGPYANKREHRVVMETVLGRKLHRDEVVHHINEVKSDNRPENLRVETRASHNRKHAKGGRDIYCTVCGIGKWYSPKYLSMIGDKYKCRPCWVKAGGNSECLRKKS